MTKTLEIGDILQLSDSKRMVYKGDNTAQMELFYPERSATGGLTRSGNGVWKSHETATKIMPLNEQQIAFWLSKK